MSSPTVSICVPAFNGDAYVADCLSSALSQTFSDFELLVVDDQSSDNTLEIAQTFAGKDPRVRVIRNARNLGLVGNWNECVRQSRGGWIKFLFQDDLLEPQCLEQMLATARSSGRRLIFGERSYFFEPGVDQAIMDRFSAIRPLSEAFPGDRAPGHAQVCQVVLAAPWRNVFGEPTSALVNRGAFVDYGLFNKNLIQLCDLEFWQRVATNEGFAYSPLQLTRFRVHANSATGDNYARRAFRAARLDPLVALHEHAFNRAYARLRGYAEGAAPPRNLANEFRRKVEVLRKRLFGPGAKVVESADRERAAWNEIAAAYPRIRAGDLRLALARSFDRHIGWRLRSR